MPRISIVLIAFACCFVSCGAQNEVCFSIEKNPFSEQQAFSGFSQYIDVLGCFHVLAESGVSDVKLLHVAAIAAELLDQDEDGVVDDPLLEAALASGQALMPVLNFEGSPAEETLFDAYEGDGISAVLYNEEIAPNEPGYWGADATVEEVLHTINHVGHVAIYPEAFSLEPNSSLLSDAMDMARGGQFLAVPDLYPSEAWYHYDDWTCDYECMAIEYLYWAIVTEMGLLNDANTADGIADEWELYSPELLASVDVLIHELITDELYMLPLIAPNGNYCPASSTVSNVLSSGREVVKIVNLLGQEVPCIPGELQFHLFDDGTTKKVISSHQNY
tara:strand:+ start:2297 stop:3292 length:996 start_codon:yes stop_codon:yes gene_type:complete